MAKSLRKHIHHVDKKLKFRLRLYFIIAIVMLSIVFYDIFKNILSIEFALIATGIGIAVGVISARMSNISWNKDANKIATSLDKFGVIFTGIYIVFAVFRQQLIGLFVHGPIVGAISFSIAAGVMIGRVVGTRGAILKILEEQKII